MNSLRGKAVFFLYSCFAVTGLLLAEDIIAAEKDLGKLDKLVDVGKGWLIGQASAWGGTVLLVALAYFGIPYLMKFIQKLFVEWKEFQATLLLRFPTFEETIAAIGIFLEAEVEDLMDLAETLKAASKDGKLSEAEINDLKSRALGKALQKLPAAMRPVAEKFRKEIMEYADTKIRAHVNMTKKKLQLSTTSPATSASN